MFSFDLSTEGFSCSLGVLFGGLEISKLQFLIKKIEIEFLAINFYFILGHQTLDPNPGSGSAIIKNAGTGSGSTIHIKSMRTRNPAFLLSLSEKT